MSESLTYHQLNKERLRPIKKAWAQANKEKINAANRAWRARNKEAIAAKAKDYYNHGAHRNKLIQQFNVMQAEILVGNDSKELLSDFKTLAYEMHERGILSDEEFEPLAGYLASIK